ncbi:MAG TPA: YcnI family protein [Conexibacter sp.]|nr:YcnI family protein [Conexibacter sp.]
MRLRITLGAALAALALVAPAASAHVSLHPNVLPAGGFATVDVRVPNERDDATTTKVQMQMPAGLESVSVQAPTGWRVAFKTRKLAKPIQTDDGPIASEVSEVDWTAGRGAGIPPGQFLQFPISISTPDKAGAVVAFPTLQTYSDGRVVRWIGPPSDESPAPTVDVSKANGPLLDVTGGDAGPPASDAKLTVGSGAATPASAATTASSSGASKGLAIAALILGALGLLAGGAALLRGGRRRA